MKKGKNFRKLLRRKQSSAKISKISRNTTKSRKVISSIFSEISSANIFSSAKFSEVFTLCVFTLWLFPSFMYHSPRNFYKLIPCRLFFCNFFCNFYGNSLRPPIFSVTPMRSSGSRVDWKIFFVIFTKLIPRKNFFCIAKSLVLMVCHVFVDDGYANISARMAISDCAMSWVVPAKKKAC